MSKEENKKIFKEEKTPIINKENESRKKEKEESKESLNNSEIYEETLSDESYLYESDEYTESSDVNEGDYFEEASSSGDSEVNLEDKWEDSDDKEEEDVDWLIKRPCLRKIEKEEKNLKIKFLKNFFSVRCKIKMIKSFEDFFVIVDSFNLIYVYKNTKSFKTYKIEYYNISDCTFFKGKLLFSSECSCCLYELDLKKEEFNKIKDKGNIKKFLPGSSSLFALGNKLLLFDKHLQIVNKFEEEFVDFCKNENFIFTLKKTGELFKFDLKLNFVEKVTTKEMFLYKNIFYYKNNLYIGKINGILILDDSFNKIKEFENLKEENLKITNYKNFIVYISNLKIIKDLRIYDKFPNRKIKLKNINDIEIIDNKIYLANDNKISLIEIDYNK